MTIAYCLRICAALPIVFCATISLADAQHLSKKLPRQKGAAHKTSATDSVLRYKIDSQLLQALAQQHKKRMANAEEPIDVGADSNGNLPVDIRATITDSLLNTITALGGKIIYPSKEYRTVRAILPLSAIKTIARRTDVQFVQPAVQAHTNTDPQHRSSIQP